MKISDTRIPDVKIVEPRVFEDDRGYFFEAFRESVFRDSGIEEHFVQDNVSRSYKNTIRGLHYQIQNPQAKLVQCLRGTILDVAVDLRQNSPSFGNYVAVKISDVSKRMLFVPKGFAHGFSVLSDEAIVSYKCSDYYNQDGERGVRWDDPQIRVNWDVERPILSDKDRKLPLLSSINEKDLF
ncbi:MAG TPA: dTDP-4-dehydrorhamnose 3,5-epimerase [Balneolaceae bacterium]|nr:dTDP-4-dehydrorhamnose 3,5-epimerase [Balneola sp.]HBQ61221.1 dTDP-4-dehydrorhamnose 3,5-epimerase [Balneolaceae bacterium]|tara:strand:- start:135586 stop:136131 length:546 start_codon:yes stop_codon:yes gene_type:complete